MNDFKKAVGILSKSRQVSMFEPPVKTLGHTKSGKVIRIHPSVEAFIEHHKDWNDADHFDAERAHLRQRDTLHQDSEQKREVRLGPEAQAHHDWFLAHLNLRQSKTWNNPNADDSARHYAKRAINARQVWASANDFKKALGILEKAKQVGMFEKQSPVLGRTQSGKPILTEFSGPAEFLRHHAEWSNQDHRDAQALHEDHRQKHKAVHETPWGVKIDVKDNALYRRHNHMSYAHMHTTIAKISPIPSIRETNQASALANVKWANQAGKHAKLAKQFYGAGGW